MRKPNRPTAWYEERAFHEAERMTDSVERRKHLNIAWRSRMAITQRTPAITLEGLKKCYNEGAELLDDLSFETVARQIAQVADALTALKRTRGGDRLFALMDDSGVAPCFTLRHIRSFDEAYKMNYRDALPYSPFGVELTDQHAIVRVSRTQEIASVGEAGVDSNPTKVQIARVTLPWVLHNREMFVAPESWAGTLIVGRRAISKWVEDAHEEPNAALFAECIRGLPEDAYPVVTYEKHKRKF